MNHKNKCRTGWLVYACLVALSIPKDAGALEIKLGDGLTGNFDTTVSFGGTVRTSGADDALIGRENGGTANSVNGDNGNLNYDSGDLTSAVAKMTHELFLEAGPLSFFGRGFYFIDGEIIEGGGNRTAYTERAEEEIGRDFELLDAYAALDVGLGSTYLTLRGGNQVLSWGESTFIQNGINTISPIDVSKLRVAGAELRDGLTAVPTAHLNWSLNSNLALEGFYQFYFDHTEIEPEGTFFSTNDFASPGGNTVMLGFGQPGISDNPVFGGANVPVGSAVPRQQDRDAKDDGQFGVALRLFAPVLNDTEFGFYMTRLHSRLPLISALAGTRTGLADGNYAATARYFREFPEDIDTYGVSFNTSLGSSGIALQGELALRQDQPVQIDDVELLFAALTPVSPTLFGQNQIGVFDFEDEIRGWERQDMMQFQTTATMNLGPLFGGNQYIALGEYGITSFSDLKDPDVLRYEGPGTFTSGNEFFTDQGVQPATQMDGFADKTSQGYRFILRGTYNDAIGSVNLTPQIAWSHDVSGTTPSPVVNFVENRKALTVSLTATYLHRYRAQLAYTDGSGDAFNLLKDRDFLSATFSYSF